MKSPSTLTLALVAAALAGVVAISPLTSNGATRVALASAARPAAMSAAGMPARSAMLNGDLQSTLEQVYQNSKDSVVNIQVTLPASAGTSMQGLPDFGGQMPQIPGLPNFGQQTPEQPNGNGGSSRLPQALGSGFVWDKLGHIVTNNHVAGDATKIQVTFADGTTVPATLVGHDPDSDLAVIKVDPKGLDLKPVTAADSNGVQPGQFTVAIGNPFGLEGTLTFGIISAVGRSMPANQESAVGARQPGYTIPDVIQTDTPINPGNSGGVLLDMEGKLIGVPTAIESQVGQSAGIGFAVPSNIVSNIVPSLIQDGKVEHAWLGMSGGTLQPELAQAMNLPANQHGAMVADVTKGGPADKAGLLASTQQVTIDGQDVKVGGDVITAIDGQPVKRFEDIVSYLASAKVGQSVKLTLLRDGKSTTVTATLGSRPTAAVATASTQGNQQPQPNQQQPNQPNQQQPKQGQNATTSGWLGIGGIDVTSEIAQAMSLPSATQGVLVETVVPNGPADKAGLVAGQTDFTTSDGQQITTGGDVITAVDGKAVAGIQALSRLIAASKPGTKVTLTVLQDGSEQQVTVTLGTRPAASN